LKAIYRNLPTSVRKIVEPLRWPAYHILKPDVVRRESWIRKYYREFAYDEKRRTFASIARFCHLNRPLNGYYFEFGSNGANTMRMAYDYSRHLFDWTYVSFDSFEGLPEVQETDKQDIWEKGGMSTALDEFLRITDRHGIPRDRLITVKGFYEESLTDELKAKLHGKKAAVVYVDCDLYHSTVPVLEFVTDFLQYGTIIVFDDWNCYHGDPDLGERLAFREYRDRHPSFRFEPFVSTGEAQAFIYLGSARPSNQT
jgi:O-methyltransferase